MTPQALVEIRETKWVEVRQSRLQANGSTYTASTMTTNSAYFIKSPGIPGAAYFLVTANRCVCDEMYTTPFATMGVP